MTTATARDARPRWLRFSAPAGYWSSAAVSRRRSSSARSGWASWPSTATMAIRFQWRRACRPRSMVPGRSTTIWGKSTARCCAEPTAPVRARASGRDGRGLRRHPRRVAVGLGRDAVGHDIGRLGQDYIRFIADRDVLDRLDRREPIGLAARVFLAQSPLILCRALELTLLEVQRHGLLLSGRIETREAGEQPLIVSIVRGAVTLLGGERLHQRSLGRQRAERNRRNAIPGQCVLEHAFTGSRLADGGGQREIRRDAAQLRALAGHAVKFTDRDGKLSLGRLGRPAIERDHTLHGALAEAGLADDQAAVVILDCAGEDFRSRSAGAIDQHREWPGIGLPWVGFIEHLELSGGILELNRRPMVDEQMCQADALGQVAAAIPAQIQHQPIHAAAGGKLLQQPTHVVGGAAVFGITRATVLHVVVEARHRDDADLVAAAIALQRAYFLFRGLRLERHFVAREL